MGKDTICKKTKEPNTSLKKPLDNEILITTKL